MAKTYLILKPDVSIQGLELEMQPVLRVIYQEYSNYNKIPVVTAGTEYNAKHLAESYHNFGLALDFRVKYFPLVTQKVIASAIIARLSNKGDYTIILHPNHHLHIQANKEPWK